MRNREKIRLRLRSELDRRGIKIKKLPYLIPYSRSTCYKYLNGEREITNQFIFDLQKALDEWDNRTARP